jgi:hypothetical protein
MVGGHCMLVYHPVEICLYFSAALNQKFFPDKWEN